MADEGVGESSKAESVPPGESAQNTSRSVFLSYASHDADTANSVCQFLESHGVSCWLAPRDVRPGTEYADAIVGAINEAKAVVLVLSGSAVASSHVGREIERAASKHKQIVAFRIDTAPLSRALEYFLSNSQWINVPALGMPAALVKLAEAVGQGTAQRAVANTGIRAKKKLRRLAILAALGLGVGVSVVLGVHFWTSKTSIQAPRAAAVAIADKSIAVLPFVDMSEKKDQEYFADGMAEEILNLLVKIPDLKVIGRTSSFQFKGKTDDLRKVGTALGAAYVVEGSVRRSGDHIRVTAQLIDTRDGAHRWSDTYDREASDTLKVQDEIAASLVRALQLEVASSRFSEERAVPRNGEAYDTYLRGLHAFNRFDQSGMDEAVAHFRHALTLDPLFVPAAEQLARTLCDQPSWGFVPPSTGYEQARVAADAALKLDPKSAIAHAVLGCVHIWYDWDWPAAVQEMNTAMALNPNDPFVLVTAADQRMAIGLWAEAVTLCDAALSTDPLLATVYQNIGWAYMYMGRYAEAERAMRRVLEISPTYGGARHDLGVILVMEGKAEEALGEIQKETPLGGRAAGLVLVYHELHRKQEADAELTQLEAEHSADMAMWIAEAHAFRGQKDQAFTWLDRAYAQKDYFLWTIKGDPLLKNLEGDPRFKAFLKKMNLPE
jgi:TolB-like protein/Tfp pilus assembly protein PilF